MPDASPAALEFLSDAGPVSPLFIVLHGVGGNARNMAPMGEWLRHEYPGSAVLVPDGLERVGALADQRQWFSVEGITESNRPERVARALPLLVAYVKAAQDRFGVVNTDTAIVGFSQGAIMGLELASAHDGLVGRVLAFSGRYASLPVTAPKLTTLHLFHGLADPVMPADHAREAFDHLASLGADVTLDLAEGVGHQPHPVLLECAASRLHTRIPLRAWTRALGSAPGGGAATKD